MKRAQKPIEYKHKTKSIASLRKYSTNLQVQQRTVTLGDIMKLNEANVLQLADEQRVMEAKNAAYYERAARWILNLLVGLKNNAWFMEAAASSEIDNIFSQIGIVAPIKDNSLPQTLEVSIKKEYPGVLFVSDGQHRYLNYLVDFINGDIVIDSKLNLKDAWLQSQLEQILKCAPNDGFDVKTIAWGNMSDDWKEAFCHIKVDMNIIKAGSEEERAHRFTEVNDAKALSSNDGTKAKYGGYTMFKSIRKFCDAINASQDGEKIVFSFGTIKNEDADYLRAIMVQENSRLPFIVQNALLTYIGDDEAENLGWKYGKKHTQLIYDFFQLTKSWKEKRCNQLLSDFTQDLIKVSREVYSNGKKKDAVNWRMARTFTTGVIAGYYETGDEEFLQAAHEVANAIDLDKVYSYKTEDGKTENLTMNALNNTYYNRKFPEAVKDAVMVKFNSKRGAENV